jgi:pimeloyl-ACP methyl ester carboxylesterase
MAKLNKTLFLLVAIFSVSTTPAQANTLDFLFGAGSFGRKHSPIADCRSLYGRMRENTAFMKGTDWKNRVVPERSPQFQNDLEYLNEMKYQTATLGLVDTRFSKEFDTRFYYTSTAKPRPDGTIPMVDPEAKAVVIYIHGSGTEKASGINFAGKCNTLARLGYACVGFDLPFHRDGSRNPGLANTKAMAEYMDSIVKHLRNPNQKVILVGHSFGPDIIAEYISRYPFGVDGAVMLSPGSFDKVTKKWFANKTVYMDKTFGDVEANNFGGRWASMVTRDNIWNDPKKRLDPTIENPNLKAIVVSGDKEEYVPGELDKAGYPTDKPRTYDVKKVFNTMFKNAEVTIEPGVGHYIFAHNDANEHDVVLRSILRANNESLNDEKAMRSAVVDKNAKRSAGENVAGKFSKDIFFRDWLEREARLKHNMSGQEFVAKVLNDDDKKAANKLLLDFRLVENNRVEQLNKNIARTHEWAPIFFEKNRAAIEKLNERGFDPSGLHKAYLDFLANVPKEIRAKYSVADDAIYVVPEKPAFVFDPNAPRGPRKENDQKAKAKQKKLEAQQKAQQEGQGQGAQPAVEDSPQD